VKDSHELFFHIFEAMAVNLTIERGPVSFRLPSCSYLTFIFCKPSNPSSALQTNPASAASAGVSAYGAQTNPTGVNDQFSHLPILQRSIVTFILSQPTRDEGIHVGKIAQAIGNGNDCITIRYGNNFLEVVFNC
jgi:replication factor A2